MFFKRLSLGREAAFSAPANLVNLSDVGHALYKKGDATTLSSLTAADVGKRIQNAPKNSATIWSTDTIAPNKP
ncbi:TonB-dependent receptor [Gluconobacter oxydans]|nr:TonB-dependent receptor protein [Gluconobacter oxydans H24]ANQ40784.1 TonB-dependent receptor [Gluconobacter oxydans]